MNLTARALRIPLRLRQKQASADRTAGESVWVEVEREGNVGVGEGTPRSYVTGEDVDGALAWIHDVRATVEATVWTVDSVRAFVAAERAALDRHPAAWCAVETAILDMLGHEAGVSVERLLGLPEVPERFRYTVIVSDGALEDTVRFLERVRAGGIRELKIKLRGELAVDRERLALVRALGPTAVRLDANNVWGDDVDAALAHLRAVGSFDAIEEPLAPGRAASLSTLSVALGVPVVLDESACRPADLAAFDGLPGRFLVNLKVAKCGGLLRTLHLLDAARARGWSVIVGAHMGETSVLTRLGIAVSREAGDAVVAMEGASGLLLLETEPVRPVLQLGSGGWLDVSGLRGSGLGLVAEGR